MRRRTVMLAVWAFGTIAATALASTAVMQVTSEVGPEPPLPVPQEVALDVPAGPAAPAARRSEPAQRDSSRAATSTAEPSTAESYSLKGGVVTVRYTDGGARLAGASPASGFTVEVNDGGPPSVDVRFRSDDHQSRLRAEWSNGRPDVRSEEDDR